MRRSGKGLWPVALALVVILVAVGAYLYSRMLFVDSCVAGTPYKCGNGVNVIVVANPYGANNYTDIVRSVEKAIDGGGTNSSIIVVTGVFDDGSKSHLDDLFKGLTKTKAKAVYAYPTNLESVKYDNVVCLLGGTDTVSLKDKGEISASAEVQLKAGLVTTQKKVSEDAEDVLQIWDINSCERRDIDCSNASMKILVGTKDNNRIGCDAFIFAGAYKSTDDVGVVGALGGLSSESSYNFETNGSRVVMYCGTAGKQNKDNMTTRHSIGKIEFVSVTE